MVGLAGMLCSVRGLLILTLWLCNISLFLSRTSISIAILYMFPHNDTLEGELLAAFYVGYCFQTIGGWCASRWGTRVVLLCAITAALEEQISACVKINGKKVKYFQKMAKGASLCAFWTRHNMIMTGASRYVS